MWKNLVILVTGAALIVFLDQFTKHLVASSLPLNGGFEVIQGYLNIVYTRNPGAAFGILSDSQSTYRWLFFVAVAGAAVVLILWLAVSGGEDGKLVWVGYALFLGGVVGNLIDRVRFREVVDFLDFHVGALHWPAFNVADSALCVGTALFFLHLMKKKE